MLVDRVKTAIASESEIKKLRVGRSESPIDGKKFQESTSADKQNFVVLYVDKDRV